MSAPGPFRRARAEDLPALTELCLRSKAHWGYDAAFIEACRDDLTLRTSDLETSEVWMIEGPVAIVQVVAEAHVCQIRHLFLDPELIGQGLGRHTFEFACSRVRAMGCSKVTLASEPLAAGFYKAMGGQLVGSEPSSVFAGRDLPVFAFQLLPSDDEIAAALMSLAQQRGAGKTFCPSEAARALAADWRPLMPEVRRVAAMLPLRATQKGAQVDATRASGPIRLSLHMA